MLQNALFLIDEIYADYKKSKNIFTRKYKFKKRYDKIEKNTLANCKEMTYDNIYEFIRIYNSTYEFIRIDTDEMEMKVIDDEISMIKYLSIVTKSDHNPKTISIHLRDNGIINVTIRDDNDITKIPINVDLVNKLIYTGDNQSLSEVIDIVKNMLLTFISSYMIQYLLNKDKKQGGR